LLNERRNKMLEIISGLFGIIVFLFKVALVLGIIFAIYMGLCHLLGEDKANKVFGFIGKAIGFIVAAYVAGSAAKSVAEAANPKESKYARHAREMKEFREKDREKKEQERKERETQRKEAALKTAQQREELFDRARIKQAESLERAAGKSTHQHQRDYLNKEAARLRNK
jgi:uncharacterized membrane protein YgaE (UPF0421/DUF939 family)